jgi:hypothetical protein
MKIAYIHRYDIENPGDLCSSPMHYLGNTRNGVVIDVFANDIPEMSVDAIIVGGGALLTNKKFVRNLNHKLDKIQSKITIAWGVGYDPDNIDSSIAEQFDLFSTREYKVNPKMQWVPCSSVLHDIFRELENTTPTKDFLVVDHFKRSIEFNNAHTRIINRPNNIRNIAQQIADHRFVITSSYHVAYWSILMGRKCAIIGESLPTKFNRMKHFPVKAKAWHNELYDQAKSWPDARYESILANYRFHRQIEDLMGIENPLQLLSMQYSHLKRKTT